MSKLGGGAGGHKCVSFAAVFSRTRFFPFRTAAPSLLTRPRALFCRRRNWKDRYFVMSDHLYYYDSKKAYEKDPNDTLGRINLVAYYVSRTDPDTNEFCVHAYPKVRPFVGSPPPPSSPARLPFLSYPLPLPSLSPNSPSLAARGQRTKWRSGLLR